MTPAPPPEQWHEDEDLVNWRLVWNWARFVAGAPFRHRWLSVTVILVALCAAGASLWALPKMYETNLTVLAEQNVVIPTLSNPGRVRGDWDTFFRAADKLIMRNESLETIVHETNLVAEFQKTRAPAQRFGAWLRAHVSGPPSREDLVRILVGTLEKRLKVEISHDTVSITVRWEEPHVAARIAEAAYRVFLESRHAAELAAIGDSIALLEQHAAKAQAAVEEAADALRVQRGAHPAPRPEPPRQPLSPQETVRSEEPGASKLLASLEVTRRGIEDLEESRQRRIVELQGRLTENLATYGPSHPAVVGIQENIRLLSTESPQVTALRKKERELAATLERSPARSAAARSAPIRAAREMTGDLQVVPTRESEAVEQARRRLVNQLERYDDLVARLGSARMELDVVRVAFRYRYSILRPVEVPLRPVTPKAPKTLAVGLVVGLLAAIAGSLGRDLATGVFLEPWQVGELLDVPVLTSGSPQR